MSHLPKRWRATPCVSSVSGLCSLRRNPLGVATQSAQILMIADAPETARVLAVERILVSNKRMAEMITNLLEFASTQLGEHLPMAWASMSIPRETCQLAIDEIAAQLRPPYLLSTHPHARTGGARAI